MNDAGRAAGFFFSCGGEKVVSRSSAVCHGGVRHPPHDDPQVLTDRTQQNGSKVDGLGHDDANSFRCERVKIQGTGPRGGRIMGAEFGHPRHVGGTQLSISAEDADDQRAAADGEMFAENETL